MTRTLYLTVLALTALTPVAPARAELPAELRVYDDGLDEPGEFGFEIHANRTLSRRRHGESRHELSATRGLRLTPEISYGISPTTEVSILFPTLVDGRGVRYLGGQQLQLKWLPLQAPAEGGWFAGVNFELVTATRHFDAIRNSVEIRPIVGYRDREWAVIANLLTRYGLTRGNRGGGFDLSPAFKVSRAVGDGVHAGVELYTELGKLADPAPRREQAHTAYLTVDVDRAGWKLNFGVGRGLTGAADPWVLKAIVEFPVDY